MKLRRSIAIAVSLVALSVLVSGGDTNHTFQRAAVLSTWLWDTSRIVTEPDQVIDNLKLHHVSVLHLQVEPMIETRYYNHFIREARAAGIAVNALDGSPHWLDEGQAAPKQFMEWVEQHQAQALEHEGFSGIHIDVEPYEHPDYETRQAELIESFQRVMIELSRTASRVELPFEMDIPFWYYGVAYDNVYGNGNLAEWLFHYTRHVTIMAYRDQAYGPNGVIAISAAQLRIFQENGVKVTIAVETGKLTEEYAFVTFHGRAKRYLNKQLQFIYDEYRHHSAFAGIAVHYYDSWIEME